MTLVAEAMNRALVAVAPDATLAEAAAVLRETGAEHVLVLDEGALVGTLCACALRGAAGGGAVLERMSAAVATVRPDAEVEDAALAMAEVGAGFLPVALGGLILGTVGEEELSRAGVPEPRPRCRQAHRRRGRTEH
jgi:acetoin utilization protein AcuB